MKKKSRTETTEAAREIRDANLAEQGNYELASQQQDKAWAAEQLAVPSMLLNVKRIGNKSFSVRLKDEKMKPQEAALMLEELKDDLRSKAGNGVGMGRPGPQEGQVPNFSVSFPDQTSQLYQTFSRMADLQLRSDPIASSLREKFGAQRDNEIKR